MTAPDILFDMAVVGGGINGCGIARDAAGRGLKVLLIERGDLAQGTSSASTKLIHGGLRYLEHREFALVREALAERERLWAIAPHIIHPMRFVLPWMPGLRPRWMLRAGLFLYDHIGGRNRLPVTESIDLRRHPAGGSLQPGFSRGYVYSDAWVDDARLVVLNARDAADRGATVLTRTPVTGMRRERDVWRIEVQGQEGGGVHHARIVVNAAGPSVLDLLARAGRPASRRLRLVRGSHIVVPRLFDHDFAYFLQLPDGRIFFAIPYARDFTLVGTTDRDHPDAETAPVPAAEEVAYLCDGANAYFSRQIRPADVVWSYAGVRPLVEDGSNRPEAATRGYMLELDRGEDGGDAPLLSVFGGKITTYRHLAEAALDRLAPFLPGGASGPWTDGAPLPGGDMNLDGLPDLVAQLAQRYPFLASETVDRIARAYGTLAHRWLGDARTPGALGEDFGHGFREAELRWLIDREWALDADDVLWRRTKLGLRFGLAQKARLATWMAQRRG